MTALGYEIRVAGAVSESVIVEMEGAVAEVERTTTVLRGTAVDESALYGIFNRLHAAGLELLEFHRVPRVIGAPGLDWAEADGGGAGSRWPPDEDDEQ